ncbi:MAG: hypothetical protein IBJ03_16415 [Gemmatimonadaceae bacterium]|nr:hypothetical protein [Gemmatimonadaceae bacterium]
MLNSPQATLRIISVVLLASVTAAIGCGNDPDITEPIPYRAIVYGMATQGGAPIAGRSVTVRAYSSNCQRGGAGEGRTTTDAQGYYRVFVTSLDGGGAKCIVTLLPPLTGSDTLRDTASITFKLNSPFDSVQRNLVRMSP